MLTTLEEGAVPHFLTNIKLPVKREAIMLAATLNLFLCSALIVIMTIIVPVKILVSVAVPTITTPHLEGKIALQPFAPEFVFTGLCFFNK
jgi:hypothetical protein